MEQLLWIETLIKGSIGACLLISPKLTIRLFALPETNSSFWPRLVGALLAGLAGVSFLTGAKVITDGIGLAGLAVLNLGAGALLLTQYTMTRGSAGRRQRTALGLLGVLLLLIAIVEIIIR